MHKFLEDPRLVLELDEQIEPFAVIVPFKYAHEYIIQNTDIPIHAATTPITDWLQLNTPTARLQPTRYLARIPHIDDDTNYIWVHRVVFDNAEQAVLFKLTWV